MTSDLSEVESITDLRSGPVEVPCVALHIGRDHHMLERSVPTKVVIADQQTLAERVDGGYHLSLAAVAQSGRAPDL